MMRMRRHARSGLLLILFFLAQVLPLSAAGFAAANELHAMTSMPSASDHHGDKGKEKGCSGDCCMRTACCCAPLVVFDMADLPVVKPAYKRVTDDNEPLKLFWLLVPPPKMA